eukprot:TRINITY_DN15936_c0_g1_i1.p1 TRINITY_DN15936_c0_g1~~TRINITY_DN15936_c0_g1_i1.p1  ORF type:complete len:490 (+),score=103.90 TRINITY_DN15936_c0_g1_i1:140-1609(+)
MASLYVPTSLEERVLRPETLSPNIIKAEYGVRGEIYLEAQKMVNAGKDVVFMNVGNPHALGQKPLTFPRQVMALCQAPFLLDDPNVGKLFPRDAIARARQLLKMTGIGGVGAYSDSRGVPGVRQEVARFIERRDGFPSDPEHIYLTDGASPAVKLALQLLIRAEHDGILVPIPQYPLYSATVQMLGGSLVPYLLDEKKGWGMNIDLLKEAVSSAKRKGIMVRGLVVINPGNPTGQCLERGDLEDIIKFCIQERVTLLADEVYQVNVYQSKHPFVSFKKVLCEMGAPYSRSLELFSFHTVSKGFTGECGQRGGYVEFTNIHPEVLEQCYKIVSVSLSPNVTGQLMVGLMCNPPQPGDPSYEQYAAESKEVLESLGRKARALSEGFNKFKNMQCNEVEGALYAFAKLQLPPGAIAAAKKAGKAPDAFYCLELLKATGMSATPGSGFGQEDGTFHFRTTILPEETVVPGLLKKVERFNDEFMTKYSTMQSRL